MDGEANWKYHPTMEPLGLTRQDGKIILANRLTGNFSGKPLITWRANAVAFRFFVS